MQKITKKIPSPSFFKKEIQISATQKKLKLSFDRQIKQNLVEKNRFVVVVGPCSADNVEAVTEYLNQLKQLADIVSQKMLIVARIFTSKPRTDGMGYLGLAFHQNADENVDFEKGILRCRQLMKNCLDIGLPVADELLFPQLSKYFDDLVSYQFLGARSSLDPLHRAVASGLDVAVGVKNSIDGDLAAVVKSVFAVQTPKQYLLNGKQIETTGNQYSHVVLRGFHDGNNFQKNCNKESTAKTLELMTQLNIKNPFIMVDCSHANSGKISLNQIENALNVANDKNVNGIILESYLKSGVAKNCFGMSKTDDCLDFPTTKKLVLDLFDKL